MGKTYLSGIKPTNKIHIGNLFGSIFQWVRLLEDNKDSKAIFIVVDQHAITVEFKPSQMSEDTFAIAATYLAAGIDPDKHIIFVQSQNPDHAYLSWIFTCITPLGWLERMTQYKDLRQKYQGKNKSIGTGILMYPVLMAADILLYDPDIIPVGEDQIQHVELARDIAKRFNSKFGQVFKIPSYYVGKVSARVKDLVNPSKKMSKSDETGRGVIFITDSPEAIREKIMKATTDSYNQINYDKQKQPGISNLLEIYSFITSKDIYKIVEEYQGVGYAKFKSDLADLLIEYLAPFQKKYFDIMKDKGELEKILKMGLHKAQEISQRKIDKVKKALGFLI